MRANSQHGVLSDPNVDKRITDAHGEAATTPHSYYLSVAGSDAKSGIVTFEDMSLPGYARRPDPDRHENGPDR
ncbi:MAG TPA: hypothetical protein VFT47_02575 [Vicinamibacterales bacterium]|nr:hypothetical protein [Vicinamibacterales bacterium]